MFIRSERDAWKALIVSTDRCYKNGGKIPPGNALHVHRRGAIETILIVDDEPAVRKTFEEWLEDADLGCRVLSVADAEAAFSKPTRNRSTWPSSTGTSGPATTACSPRGPLCFQSGHRGHHGHRLRAPGDAPGCDADGRGDYLDKNQDLNRETFLKAVRRQLERIRPAKRERQLHQSLVAFREAVEKVLPLVQSAAALTDPVPLPDAIRAFFASIAIHRGVRRRALDAAMIPTGSRQKSADVTIPAGLRWRPISCRSHAR